MSVCCDCSQEWFHWVCVGLKGTEPFLSKQKLQWKCPSFTSSTSPSKWPFPSWNGIIFLRTFISGKGIGGKVWGAILPKNEKKVHVLLNLSPHMGFAHFFPMFKEDITHYTCTQIFLQCLCDSVLGIPFSYYCSILGISQYPPGTPKSCRSSPPKKF